MVKWTNTKITVQGRDGPKDIMALCKGIFAIHDNIEFPHLKTLTHIPSGYYIISESTKHKLYRAAKELSLLDWHNISPDESNQPETFDKDKFRAIQRRYD